MQIIDGKVNLFGSRTGWGFRVAIDGDDLLLQSLDGGPVIASFFGGSAHDDPGDNGMTASGVSTRNDDGSSNDVQGCSLPHDPRVSKTAGSPIPLLPYRTTQVKVFNPANNEEQVFPLLDDGPAFGTGHAIDLTRAAFRAVGGDFDAGLLRVNVRIIGGAQHLSDAVRAEAARMLAAPPQG